MSTTYADTDPRSRPPETWKSRLGALASRGEVDGPRVEECRRALAWWAAHKLFSGEIDRGAMTVELAEQMLDMLRTRGAAS
ncbi:hypothetical protein [Nocardia cyriacigeorgica]|uniref:hypothetical protein n=1 Tax=Nocardia cyriacigeorgica TaxID=135487 RepID=UPI001892F7F6|nr:hypothetical protein [Nocardia cyriacigeorgica]MBF6161056.1 hypothetical protein [Nocardia cyriacigeorgica]MBF6199855.1 hypothetical protein [Nocardia cyriacigeorgica]